MCPKPHCSPFVCLQGVYPIAVLPFPVLPPSSSASMFHEILQGVCHDPPPICPDPRLSSPPSPPHPCVLLVVLNLTKTHTPAASILIV